MYIYLKALHIIFVVTWFCGILYLGRLYVYNREAQDKAQIEKEILTTQFNIMIKRLLFGIAWPSAIITLLFGLSLLYLYKGFPLWLMLKLAFVFLLFLYQFSLHIIYKKQSQDIFNHSSTQLRLWNEVPTIILFAVVFLVVVKQGISLVYSLAGLVVLIILIKSAVKIYKSLRMKNSLKR